MKLWFYAKLAWEGIKKNRQMYIPYILSGCSLTAMTYILFFLASSDILTHMKGGDVLGLLLPVGIVVVCLFSLIFMFYCNSFLIRHRNREFGLYNVLGMDKKNLGRIMLWENLTVYAISVSSGLVFGIALSKLAELGMVNLLKESISYTLRIDFTSVLKTALVFAGTYVLLFLNSFINVLRSSASELLRSTNIGEKTPKANWLLAVIGIIVLCAAYYIALSIKQPLQAIVWFMVASVMVITATYLLFIAGSVALCRILQKNKKYYYKPNHFVSVSSMVYRMKRNGAGLASICILITIVLVMLSSTISLYVGAEDSLASNYPNHISITSHLPNVELFNEESFSKMRSAVNERVQNLKNIWEYHAVEIAGLSVDGNFIVDQKSHSELNMSTLENLCYLNIITLDDYNRIMAQNETLTDRECLLYCYKTEFTSSTITIEKCEPLKIKNQPKEMELPPYMMRQTVPVITLVTKDISALIEPLFTVTNKLDKSILEPCWYYSFDIDGGSEKQVEVYKKLRDELDDIVIRNDDGSYTYILECRENARVSFYGLYGALFLIGILLSIVFVFAVVLIIYYKQISEGYDDRKRFEVMQNIGMTKAEIRRSINSQVLTVFFMPLVLSGIHLAVAFPIICKLMTLFMFENTATMAIVTAVCFLLFALIYALVYRITSNAYYAIVTRH